MTRTLLIAGLVLGALALAGCSSHKEARTGPLAVSEAELGPETGDLIKSLPPGLVGDKANARYTNQNLRGEDDGGE